jgi:hypothetical protein
MTTISSSSYGKARAMQEFQAPSTQDHPARDIAVTVWVLVWLDDLGTVGVVGSGLSLA